MKNYTSTILVSFFSFLNYPNGKLLATNSHEDKATLVKTSIVTEEEVSEKLELVGECRGAKRQSYHANISGNVDFLSTKEGKVVKKGEKIISINSREANLMLQTSKLKLKIEEFRYKVSQDLYREELISYEALMESELALEKARLEYEKSFKTYKDQIITAPFSGFLNPIPKKVGEQVKNGDILFTLVDNKNCDVDVILPDSFLSKGEAKKSVEVFVRDEQSNKIVKAEVVAIGCSVSPQGGVSMRLLLQDNHYAVDGSIIPVEILYNRHTALTVPEKAIMIDNIGNYIYKIDREIAEKIYLKTGLRRDGRVEIFSNKIKKGDQIIVEGLTKIYDGDSVKISE